MPDPDKPLPLLPGGVMRCCIDTYSRRAPAAGDTNDGDLIPCDYCTSRLIASAGYWGWDREYDMAPEQ